jgi:hypothetical protein
VVVEVVPLQPLTVKLVVLVVELGTLVLPLLAVEVLVQLDKVLLVETGPLLPQLLAQVVVVQEVLEEMLLAQQGDLVV